jgi:succinate dehydrogenase / fumarate reductase cytochrome b subunit
VSASGRTSSLPPLRPENRAFVLRKLHSLSGVFPLGAFLVLHLWTNAQALSGREGFDRAVTASTTRPFAAWLEVLLVFVPLAFHAGYGLKLSLETRVNVRHYPGGKNWGYVMQRVTGVVALLFVVVHVYQYRLRRFDGKLMTSDFYSELCASLSSTHAGVPWMAVGYLIGIAACVFHFSNGLYGFCFSWGITRSRRGTRFSSLVFGSLGVVLFALAAAIVIYFATGSRLLFAAQEVGPWSTTRTCQDVLTAGSDESDESKATPRALSPSAPVPPSPPPPPPVGSLP